MVSVRNVTFGATIKSDALNNFILKNQALQEKNQQNSSQIQQNISNQTNPTSNSAVNSLATNQDTSQTPQTNLAPLNKDTVSFSKDQIEKNKKNTKIAMILGGLGILTGAVATIFALKNSSKANQLLEENKKATQALTDEFNEFKDSISLRPIENIEQTAQETSSQLVESYDKSKRYIAGASIASFLTGALGYHIIEKKDIIKKPKNAQKESDDIENTDNENTAPDLKDNPSVSIWGNFTLDNLDNSSKISDDTALLIQKEIQNTVNRTIEPPSQIDKKDAHIWSISYETPFNNAGGQRDIAEELPVAFSKQGIDTYAIAPLFDASYVETDGSKTTRTLTKLDNGKYQYRSKCYKKGKPIELDLVYEGKIPNGANMRIFKGNVDGQNYLFLNDDTYFNYHDKELIGGTGANATVYASFEQTYKDENGNEKTINNNEKIRMAEFNTLVYEALSAIQEDKDEKFASLGIVAPNRMVAHEAWQSGGLLAKLKLYSIADEKTKLAQAQNEEEKEKISKKGEYLRQIANSTVVPIHNIGEGYQAMDGNTDLACEYFNNIYGAYAHDIVYNSCIDNVHDENGSPIFGTEIQRVGFRGDCMNPASASLALAYKIGPVSAGYGEELLNSDLAGEKLTPLIKIKNSKRGKGINNVGYTPFPNGVDKMPLCSSDTRIENMNKSEMMTKIRELTSNDSAKVAPYFTTQNGELTPISQEEYIKARTNNKELFIALLKDAIKGNPTPMVPGNKSANYFGVFDLDDCEKINVNTPIFSMASRMDPQKGFDTIALAYYKMVENLKDNEEMPVLILSGGGSKDYQDMVQNYIEIAQKTAKTKGRSPRIFWTKERTSDDALMLMNMTTTVAMPSDFEPYGISDLKGLYAGSHALVTEVGGMKPNAKVSNKIIPAQFDSSGNITNSEESPNAITVSDYEYMCTTYDNGEKTKIRGRNAKKLEQAIEHEIDLAKTQKGREELDELNYNSLKTDVSWDKGAIQNYIEQLNINS